MITAKDINSAASLAARAEAMAATAQNDMALCYDLITEMVAVQHKILESLAAIEAVIKPKK